MFKRRCIFCRKWDLKKNLLKVSYNYDDYRRLNLEDWIWGGRIHYHNLCLRMVLKHPSHYNSNQIKVAIHAAEACQLQQEEQEEQYNCHQSLLSAAHNKSGELWSFSCPKHGNIGGETMVIASMAGEEHYYCKKCIVEEMEEAQRWEDELTKRDFEEEVHSERTTSKP